MKNSYLTYFFLVAIGCKQNAQIKTQNTSTNQNELRDSVVIGDSIINKAKAHLGKPYIAHSLDINKIENLIVRYDGFDCNTFVETVLAQTNNSSTVEDNIRMMRYRNGFIDGYASRIHYFSEWIKENVKRGFISDITASIPCSQEYGIQVDFMSNNKQKYPLITSDSILQLIVEMEKNISNYKLHYIPKNKVDNCKSYIKNGDIIAITTNKKGLDISHLGFAIWQNGKLYLIHASSDYNKIVITQNTLQEYLMSHKSQTGIIPLRLSN